MLELDLFVVFVTSMTLTFSIIPLIVRFARTYGFYDYPDTVPSGGGQAPRRIHTCPTPRLGGIGIVLGFFASMLWVSPVPLQNIYFASLLMFAVGVFDDLKPLSAKTRLLIQVISAAFVVFSADLQLEYIRVTDNLTANVPGWLGHFLSTFIIVGSVNAINLSDGLDGLAGGIVLIGIILLSILHFLSTGDMQFVLCLSVPIAGSLLGFLRYNTHPATIFMGDGGSNWLGSIVGCFMVMILCGSTLSEAGSGIQLESSRYVAPFISVLMCVAVPIMDTACVISTRLSKGQSPMSADRNHFHHSLMKLGLSHPQSVAAIYFLALIIGTAGLMPVAYPRYSFWWVPYVATGILAIIMASSLKMNSPFFMNSALKQNEAQASSKSNKLVRAWAVRVTELIVRYEIYCILAVAPLLAGVPPKALGYAATACLFLLLVSILIKDQQNFFQSFVLAVSSSILLTAINFNTLTIEFMGHRYNVHFLYNFAFMMLFILSTLYVFVTFRRKSLVMSPTDFLMVSLPLVYLFVPEPYSSDYRINIISLRSLVLFVGVRALTRSQVGVTRRIRTVSIFALSYVILASLFGLRIIY